MPQGFTEGILHGIYGREGQKLLTHVLLKTGANWSGVPLNLLQHKETKEELPLVEPWSCMGTEITISHLDYLDGLSGITLQDKLPFRHTGIVIDWLDGFSRYPQEHKPLSLLQMEAGNFGLLPNNYYRLLDKHFTSPLEETPAICANYRRGEKIYWE